MRFCLLFILSLLVVPCHAQQGGGGLEANIIAGRILKHTWKFRAPVEQLATAVELNWVKQTDGRKAWQQRRGYPLLGWGLTYTNYGVDSVYGHCLSVYPNMQLPVIKGKKLECSIRMGFGLAYISKRYSRAPDWDTVNNAIGSHFNNFTTLATDLRYRVNEHWDIHLGGNFSHISNATLRTPNLGINMYGAHIGVRYFPVTSRPQVLHNVLQPLKNRWLLQLRAGISANEYGNGNGPLFPVYLFSAFASKRYAGKNKIIAGIDYSYHEGVYAFLRNNEILTGEERANSWKSAVFAGHEFLVGRFGILVQAGYYLKNTYLQISPFYQKLGANIYLRQAETGLLKEVSASVLLKAHRFDAELVEMGIGVGI
jgi:hypothetical protein